MTACLKVVLVHAPVDKLVVERKYADLVEQMKLARLIQVYYGDEVVCRSVEEELVLEQVDAVAQLLQLVDALGEPDLAQPTVGHLFQFGPGYLMF